MRKILLNILILAIPCQLFAQKTEQGFDFAFRPTDYSPRYYVTTEKIADTLWHRQAWYLPERGMAMEGWYKDKECKIAHGTVAWYHTNKYLKSKGNYVNGKKEGIWLEYGEDGLMRDSANYVAGKLKGVRLSWYANGMASDSMNFDGAGNGVQVSWYDDGNVASAGYWVSDTLKKGRWQYFHKNGKVKAIEEYSGDKRVSCNCFDESGKLLNNDACEEKEADFPGGMDAWRRFIERNLNSNVPVQKGAPLGYYTVVLLFYIDTDGTVQGIRPETSFGFGMEEEVERLLKRSPKWIPAQQYGSKVRAYRKQPITFVVQRG